MARNRHTAGDEETVKPPWETRPRYANPRNCRAFSNPSSSCQSGRLAGGGRSPHEPVCKAHFPANRENIREIADEAAPSPKRL